MSDGHHGSPYRHLRTLQGLGTILAVLLIVLVFPEALPRARTPEADTSAATSTAWRVTAVVDGDTLEVLGPDGEARVRLIGINTPETVDPRRPVECFGKEASAYAKTLLTDQEVRLEPDPTQDDRDRYGRLLRYVFLPDGRFVNLLMVAEGYAYEYTYGTAYRYQKEFREAQRQAQDADRGLWSPQTCDGQK